MGASRDCIAYQDTRDLAGRQYSFCEAVLEGLAPGGGLFVPTEIPSLSLEQICSLAKVPYAKRAATIYQLFRPDLSDAAIEELMGKAYGNNFDTPEICPIVEVEPGMHVMELWHGPTSAFKDMALQCLPHFFNAANEKLAQDKAQPDHLILVATSGDTGKAALEGFRDLPHTSIIVFYPHGGVSDIQRAQMATQRGSNVGVFAARGNFDDCQTSVKMAFADDAFNAQLLADHNIALSSANSINWGRLLPQVCYYIHAYAQMVASGAIAAGDSIDVCVPTGNFGNILAAWYAREMGTPIERLVCASNENRVLTDFINTGIYDISNRQFILTPSPSMDILVSSNLERQLFELSGRNPAHIRQWMKALRKDKKFQVDKETFAKMQQVYVAGSANSAQCFETIRETYEAHHYLLDPHSAVAYRVASQHKGTNPMIIASTAHWAKFGANVYKALKGIAPDDQLPAEVAALSGLAIDKLIAETYEGAGAIPQGLAELEDLPVRFEEVVEGSTEGVEACVASFVA